MKKAFTRLLKSMCINQSTTESTRRHNSGELSSLSTAWLTGSATPKLMNLNSMKVSKRDVDSKEANFQVDKSRELLLLGPSSKTPRFWSLTKLPQLWTNKARRSCSKLLTGLWKAALPSWLPTDWAPFATVTYYSCSIRAKWSNKAAMTNCQATKKDISTSSRQAWRIELTPRHNKT